MKMWEKEYNKIAEILHRAAVWYETEDGKAVTIQREDVEKIAKLAYGFKFHGGDVYITTTLNLKVCEFPSLHESYRFASYAMGALRREYSDMEA